MPSFAIRALPSFFVFDLDHLARLGGLVDGIDDDQVAQALYAARLGITSLPNAHRKCIEFRRKFVNRPERLLKPLPGDFPVQPALLFEGECW
jgi:hypothetical protein